MSVIYNIGIYFYRWLIGLVSLFNPKAKLWIDGRKDWKKNLINATKDAENLVWFHAASLGEFEQGRPLIERLKEEQPNTFILLTFYSPSGYEIQKNYKGADYVCYLPSDTKSNAKDFISITKPKQAFFIKYEFWYNYLSELKKIETPLFLISGIFRTDHIFFKPYGSWFRKQLLNFDKFFLQDQTSVDLIKSIGFKNTILTGDTRFDRVIQIAENSKEIKEVKQFVASEKCLVIGSSWPIEEEMLCEYINQNTEYKYIIAPHEINDTHIKEIESRLEIGYKRWSEQDNRDTTVLIIDNIGMLSALYKYANFAYIGGAFGSGLHNILEAAVYGIPVIFGPKITRFKEAHDLIQNKAAFSVSNKAEFFEKLDLFFNNIDKSQEFGENAKRFIYKSKGASDIVWRNIF